MILGSVSYLVSIQKLQNVLYGSGFENTSANVINMKIYKWITLFFETEKLKKFEQMQGKIVRIK